ncbi:hypothetical protein PTSG_04297 [Salpingoeca rosetta]|uniref:Uncharacterized protein n=1 Tax=Salpingoeca rosetta (strain ATCC 50818 / BSB-021) TaxID=946362 RepID=F2U760_SALR5|nr:uncharacterized protein PTSG_04297 [Salpingoeca rosetta]EGD83692.1 hypothetical protein PTSG_04297 [Salpingoeca rosetta]|eukprot:XP_004995196.1 hypothetical protein PTSG_04297 [Salpingoeca rosetta]
MHATMSVVPSKRREHHHAHAHDGSPDAREVSLGQRSTTRERLPPTLDEDAGSRRRRHSARRDESGSERAGRKQGRQGKQQQHQQQHQQQRHVGGWRRSTSKQHAEVAKAIHELEQGWDASTFLTTERSMTSITRTDPATRRPRADLTTAGLPSPYATPAKASQRSVSAKGRSASHDSLRIVTMLGTPSAALTSTPPRQRSVQSATTPRTPNRMLTQRRSLSARPTVPITAHMKLEFVGRTPHNHRVLYSVQQHLSTKRRTVPLFCGLVKAGDTMRLDVVTGEPRLVLVVHRDHVVSEKWTSCCQYGMRIGARPGGRSGQFVLAAAAGRPCLRCQVRGALRNGGGRGFWSEDNTITDDYTTASTTIHDSSSGSGSGVPSSSASSPSTQKRTAGAGSARSQRARPNAHDGYDDDFDSYSQTDDGNDSSSSRDGRSAANKYTGSSSSSGDHSGSHDDNDDDVHADATARSGDDLRAGINIAPPLHQTRRNQHRARPPSSSSSHRRPGSATTRRQQRQPKSAPALRRAASRDHSRGVGGGGGGRGIKPNGRPMTAGGAALRGSRRGDSRSADDVHGGDMFGDREGPVTPMAHGRHMLEGVEGVAGMGDGGNASAEDTCGARNEGGDGREVERGIVGGGEADAIVLKREQKQGAEDLEDKMEEEGKEVEVEEEEERKVGVEDKEKEEEEEKDAGEEEYQHQHQHQQPQQRAAVEDEIPRREGEEEKQRKEEHMQRADDAVASPPPFQWPGEVEQASEPLTRSPDHTQDTSNPSPSMVPASDDDEEHYGRSNAEDDNEAGDSEDVAVAMAADAALLSATAIGLPLLIHAPADAPPLSFRNASPVHREIFPIVEETEPESGATTPYTSKHASHAVPPAPALMRQQGRTGSAVQMGTSRGGAPSTSVDDDDAGGDGDEDDAGGEATSHNASSDAVEEELAALVMASVVQQSTDHTTATNNNDDNDQTITTTSDVSGGRNIHDGRHLRPCGGGANDHDGDDDDDTTTDDDDEVLGGAVQARRVRRNRRPMSARRRTPRAQHAATTKEGGDGGGESGNESDWEGLRNECDDGGGSGDGGGSHSSGGGGLARMMRQRGGDAESNAYDSDEDGSLLSGGQFTPRIVMQQQETHDFDLDELFASDEEDVYYEEQPHRDQ